MCLVARPAPHACLERLRERPRARPSRPPAPALAVRMLACVRLVVLTCSGPLACGWQHFPNAGRKPSVLMVGVCACFLPGCADCAPVGAACDDYEAFSSSAGVCNARRSEASTRPMCACFLPSCALCRCIVGAPVSSVGAPEKVANPRRKRALAEDLADGPPTIMRR